MIRARWTAGLFLVAVLTSAASQQAAHKRAQAAARTKAGDTQIEKAIQMRFAASKISTDKFQVHVQGGVATLDGQTDVIQHKGTATRLAKSSGAVRVVNRIRVSQAARQKAAANLARGRRRAQVKRSEDRSQRSTGR